MKIYRSNGRKLLRGAIYQHFKGEKYRVLEVAKHTETGEDLVIYQSMTDYNLFYARPLDMFLSDIDRDKYPDIDTRYRFTYIGDLNNELQ